MTATTPKPLGAGRVVLFLGLLGLFALGVAQLFMLRFNVGDIYPPYSSARADPMGTRALRESLAEIDGMQVSRNHDPLNQIEPTGDTALIIAGAKPDDIAWDMSKTPFEQRLLQTGARVVIAFVPQIDYAPANQSQPGSTTLTRNATQPTSATQDELLTGNREWNLIAQELGATVGNEPLPQSPEAEESAAWLEATLEPIADVRRAPGAPRWLPATLPLRSTRVFEALTPEWRVIYQRGTQPVLIERDVSTGTLVLAADAFYLSNEALRGERQTELLAWTLGDKHTIVFDETHLGVRLEPGIMQIAHRLGLGGTLAGLIVLGGLFVWRAMSSLVPPRDERDDPQLTQGMAEGRDSAAGFLNLLRAHIPHGKLLTLCLEQWRMTYLADHRELAPRAAQLDQILQAELSKTPSLRNTPEAYRQMSRIMKKRSTAP